MGIIYAIIILILTAIILILSLSLIFLLKKNTYISDKEKEFIVFAIDMYCEHFETLKLTTKEQHLKLVKGLEKIKLKHFKNEKNEQAQ